MEKSKIAVTKRAAKAPRLWLLVDLIRSFCKPGEILVGLLDSGMISRSRNQLTIRASASVSL